MSAHYYFRDNFYADNGIIPWLLVLEHLSTTGRKLSEVVAPIMEGHHMSGELNYRVKDTAAAIKAVREKFKMRGEEDFIDGYSLNGGRWRFNIRPSNTEPLLRLNVEAESQDLVAELRDEIEDIVRAVGA
jgi:phosphomannomutase